MVTQTISTIDHQKEQNAVLQTQVGGNGNGGRIVSTIAISEPEDNEPTATALAAEAFLIRQRITSLLNVTDQCNVITTPLTSLREQHGNATLAIFEGGAM